MAKPKPVRIRNERDVMRAVKRAGGTVRNGRGSHYVWKHNGASGAFYALHGRDEYPTGTRRSIEKQLRLAGIIAVIILITALLLIC